MCWDDFGEVYLEDFVVRIDCGDVIWEYLYDVLGLLLFEVKFLEGSFVNPFGRSDHSC